MPPISVTDDLNSAAMLLVGGAILTAEAGWLHMRGLAQTYGMICGSASEMLAHCPACYASPTLLALGVACLSLARTAAPGGPAVKRLQSA